MNIVGPVEGYLFIFFTVLFLFLLHHAFKRGNWSLIDSLSIAVTLALLAYSYAAGRFLAQIFAFGLLFFAVNKQGIRNVFRTWVIYAFTMTPLLFQYFMNSRAITQRFEGVTNLSPDRSLLQNLGVVASALNEDVSLKFLLFSGDPLVFHHVPGMGQFLVGTFALGIFGVVIILIRRKITTWWRFILFGTFVSLIPGAVTTGRYHSVRDMVFPIFFLLLTVPAISWLLGDSVAGATQSGETPRIEPFAGWEQYLRLGLLCSLLALTAVQGFSFRVIYDKESENAGRRNFYSADFLRAFDMAVEYPERPVYIEEGGGGDPIFIHTEWYAIERGIDLSNFVHLGGRDMPPEGALVLSSNPRGVPAGSDAVNNLAHYNLYRYRISDTR